MNMLSHRSSYGFRSYTASSAHPRSPWARLTAGVMPTITLNAILLGLIVFAGLSYLLVINQTSVGGYEIEELERTIDQAKREYRQMELTKAELQSLAAIEQAAQRLELVSVSQVRYLPAVGSAFAAR